MVEPVVLRAGQRGAWPMTAHQVAELLSMHIDYVRKKTREGAIPAHRLPGGRVFRYLSDEVIDWLRGLEQK